MATCYVIGGGKGGVGKSTIAINLAVHLHQIGEMVAVVDCDPKQRTSAKFFERTDRYQIACETIEKELLRSLTVESKSLAEEAYAEWDAVVFDAPGDIEISQPLFRIADVVVLPSPPFFPDVEEVVEAAIAVAAIRDARGGDVPEALLVLAKGNPSTNVARATTRELEHVQRDLRIPVSLNQLHHSVKYSEAYGAHVAVSDLKKVPEKQRQQMSNVVQEIVSYGKRAEGRKPKATGSRKPWGEVGASESSGVGAESQTTDVAGNE